MGRPMTDLDQAIADTARRHGLSEGAVKALADALTSGRGQAQFSHPELGGMGQWSGGMVQIGDMFNHGLKAKVAAACADLAAVLAGSVQPGDRAGRAGSHQSQWQGGGGAAAPAPWPAASGDWWPADLGSPDSTGGQNDTRYAYFVGKCRLAVERDRTVTVYDTGEHRISGSAQQQGGLSDMVFSSQLGPVRLGELEIVSTESSAR